MFAHHFRLGYYCGNHVNIILKPLPRRSQSNFIFYKIQSHTSKRKIEAPRNVNCFIDESQASSWRPFRPLDSQRISPRKPSMRRSFCQHWILFPRYRHSFFVTSSRRGEEELGILVVENTFSTVYCSEVMVVLVVGFQWMYF